MYCIGWYSLGFYYVIYVYNVYVGILVENVRLFFCVVKFYVIKKVCEFEGIKFFLILNFI